MLTLYSKDQQPPDDLQCLEPLYVEIAQHPIAFSANTEEEQVIKKYFKSFAYFAMMNNESIKKTNKKIMIIVWSCESDVSY